MDALERLIRDWAKEPQQNKKLRTCYKHAETLSEPDIMYYHRNAVRYVKAKEAYEVANEKHDWSARSNAYIIIQNVEKKFEELRHPKYKPLPK